jgi:hypothetical protein
MSYQTALERVAALPFPAVTVYPPELAPEVMPRAVLPALVVVPGTTQNGLFAERGSGLQTVAFANGHREMTINATLLLLVVPLPNGQASAWNLSLTVPLVDAVIRTLAADVTLGGALARPLDFTAEVGTVRYGGQVYAGCTFRHNWTLAVSV